VLYIDSKELPDMKAITEVDFILDQIDVSVQIVTSVLRMSQQQQSGSSKVVSRHQCHSSSSSSSRRSGQCRAAATQGEASCV